MATKDTVNRLNQELKTLKEKLQYLKIKEPDQYFKEKDGIMEEIRLTDLNLFRIIVEEYPKQNPIKWMDKKEKVLAKLAFMEAGGLAENFVHKPVVPATPPVQPTQTPPAPTPVQPEPSQPETPNMTSTHPEVKVDIVPETPETSPETPKFICEVCKFEAKSKVGLSSHSRKHKN